MQARRILVAAAAILLVSAWPARPEPAPEVRGLLKTLVEPVDPVSAPKGDPFQLEAVLAGQMKVLVPMVDRLETLRAGYAHLSSLERVGAERAELRARLLDGQASFNDTFDRFNALRKAHQNVELQDILGGGHKQDINRRIDKAMELEDFYKTAIELRHRMQDALGQDEEAWQAAQEEARRRRQTALGAAAAGLALAAAGIGAWLWSRRRERAAAAARSSGAIPAGTTVGGNYRIERELGRGGMGLVYEASDVSLRRSVAIKQMRSELRQNPRDLELFLDEARLVASLKHPNVVEIYSIVNEGPEVYLVFEYVAGSPLSVLLGQGPRVAPAAARGLLAQVGSALDYAHSQRVIHRDLKPANVMVTPAGGVKVMDFGLAHQAQQTVARQTRAESWGTPPYMAPEQELGTVSRESDLFSLGVMLYEVLTGRLPFPGPNYLAQKREMRFIPASRAAPGLPPGLDAILSRALHADPGQRFHSAAELVEAVDGYGLV